MKDTTQQNNYCGMHETLIKQTLKPGGTLHPDDMQSGYACTGNGECPAKEGSFKNPVKEVNKRSVPIMLDEFIRGLGDGSLKWQA